MQVVPVRLDREIIEVVDELVRLGLFSSRSEALREIIKNGIQGYRRLAKLAQAVEKLYELEREKGGIPVRLDGALDELLKEREKG